MLKKLFTLVSTMILASACSSLSTFHGANTTDKGKSSHTIGVGTLTADISTASGVGVDSDDTAETEISVPMFEYMYRRGLTDNIDVGLRSTGTVHGADVKWQFLDGDFSMATGLGLNYLGYSLESSLAKTDVTAIDVVLPLYMEYSLAPTFSVYLTPKYMNRSVSEETTVIATSESSSDSNSVGFTGGSVGIKWGKEMGVILEYTMMTGSVEDSTTGQDEDLTLSQAGVGFFF